MADINPLFTDTSHWDPIYDIDAVKKEGIVGCIIKATEGTGYTDPTYVQQQQLIKGAGLKFGMYHFCTAANLQGQIDNFLRYASPDPDELFCADWEDYGDNTMSLTNVKTWIKEVEDALKRPGECVLYSGNTAKEALGNEVDTFLGERRLWLCQYGSNPTWQRSWEEPWGWQFTDGQVGPEPHVIAGIGPCDINSYDGMAEELIEEWASGFVKPVPPAQLAAVHVIVAAPSGVPVKVHVMSPEQAARMRLARDREARG